jgi:hypothetical protein
MNFNGSTNNPTAHLIHIRHEFSKSIEKDALLFHCRRLCPVKSESHLTGVSGNGNNYSLCVLCGSSKSAGGR